MVAGFMVHGDALITEAVQQTSSQDLLLEVQGSLDKLSAFSPSHRSSSKNLVAGGLAVQSHLPGAPSAKKAEDTALSNAAPDNLLLSAVRHRRQSPAHSVQSSMEWATAETAHITMNAPTELFQAPKLPSMQPTKFEEGQSFCSDHATQMWAVMQPELLSHILQQVQWTSREAVALTGVCRCSMSSIIIYSM